MDRATELSFGLDTVRRSSEFKLGMLARRTGLLSLASWIKNGGRGRLTIQMPPTPGASLVIEAIHSCEDEPPIPWDMIEVRGRSHLVDCPTGAYGKALCVDEGSVRVQVMPTPLVLARRGPQAPRRSTSALATGTSGSTSRKTTRRSPALSTRAARRCSMARSRRRSPRAAGMDPPLSGHLWPSRTRRQD